MLWLLLRVRWRRALGPSLAVALLIGAVGGFVLASAAAAQRVANTYDIFIEEIDAPDVALIPTFDCGPVPGVTCDVPTAALSGEEIVADLREMAAVEQTRLVDPLLPYFVDADGAPLLATSDDGFGCFDGDRSVQLVAAVPGSAKDQVLPFRLEGGLPERGSSTITITRATAEREGLRIGDNMRLAGWCSDGPPVELDSPIDLQVVGLSIGVLDLEPTGIDLTLEPAFVDPAAFEALLAIGAEPSPNVMVWLSPTASDAELAELFAKYQVIIDFRERAPVFNDALATDADLLWLLAAIGAIGGLLIIAPVIGRNLRDTGSNTETLLALGARRRQVTHEAIAHSCSLAIFGALIAAIVAVPLGALMPRGFAAAIEPNRELRFDGWLTLGGVGLLIAVVVVIGLVPAWRLGASSRSVSQLVSERGGGLTGKFLLRPAARTGVQAALGNPVGPRRVSPWPSLLSMIVAAAVGVASLTYLAGLRHLERTPSVLGWNWDAVVSFDSDEVDPQQVPALMEAIGALDVVDELTTGTLYPPFFLFVPDTDINVWPWSFATGPRAITPTILEGRAPEGPDEVVIDGSFAEQSGLGIGDVVVLARATLIDHVASQISEVAQDFGLDVVLPEVPDEGPVGGEFEITGVSVLPLDPSSGQAQVAFTFDGYAGLVEPSDDELAATRAWLPDDLPPPLLMQVEAYLANTDIGGRTVFLRFAGDTYSAAGAVLEIEGITEVVAPTPSEVLSVFAGLNVDRNDRIPVALAILVGAAFAALACYLLFFSIRARRFEFAVMRALGLSTNGIRRSVAAQATATVLVVMLISVPVGVAIGRWAWLEYARDLKVLPVSVLPWSTLAIVCAAAVVFANVVALLPGWFATRRPTGVDLRSE